MSAKKSAGKGPYGLMSCITCSDGKLNRPVIIVVESRQRREQVFQEIVYLSLIGIFSLKAVDDFTYFPYHKIIYESN